RRDQVDAEVAGAAEVDRPDDLQRLGGLEECTVGLGHSGGQRGRLLRGGDAAERGEDQEPAPQHHLPVGAASPRRSRNGWIDGSLPVKLRKSVIASSLPPRDSSVARKRSPFSRVSPPWALIHSTLAASSTSLQKYE